MKKRIIALLLAALIVFSLVACNNSKNATTDNETTEVTTAVTSELTTENVTNETTKDDTPVEVIDTFETKTLNIYREAGVVDKTMDFRFYSETPHVPYISVSGYYTEFFKHGFEMEKKNEVYKYTGKDGEYLKFDVQENEISIYDVEALSNHPDFQESTSKTFVIDLGTTTTTPRELIIALNNYGVDIYGDENDVYVPITLLSIFSGGMSGYNIAYNGKDIYVLDNRGQLSNGEKHDAVYFGEQYLAVLHNLEEQRYEDLVKYNYGLLCLDFDNFRGYTSQLVFGDNNLVTLGLNGLLEKYYPMVKDCLMSLDKYEYLEGILVLSIGLFDGGHTAMDTIYSLIDPNAALQKYNQELRPLIQKYAIALMQKLQVATNFGTAKQNAFADYNPAAEYCDIYHFDEATKTAYVSFDSFVIDYESWDKYYNEGLNPEDIPTSNDTFSFVLRSFYRALEDGAENVILDLTTNGGGNSEALVGIVGLVNGAKVCFEMNDVANHYRISRYSGIDINLDGVFDDKDVEEAGKFTFNVGVLTSGKSFSCGNLLPSLLKELGCKIIGQRSGGGSCAITYVSTADGITILHSSSHCLSNASGDNIDSGVELDYEILNENGELDCSLFYDFEIIAAYYESLKPATVGN